MQLKFHLWEEKWKSLTWNYQEIAPPVLAIKESKREPSEVDFGTVITRVKYMFECLSQKIRKDKLAQATFKCIVVKRYYGNMTKSLKIVPW